MPPSPRRSKLTVSAPRRRASRASANLTEAAVKTSKLKRVAAPVRRPRAIPPERIWLVGTDAAGCARQARAVAAKQGLTVKRVALGRVVSKYLGETEKNLERLFNSAEEKCWLLFFDEADALFGKRTEVRDAHDRFANQTANYLLERIEQTDVPVVFASAHKQNLDPAFLRRLRHVVAFSPVPPKPV